MFRKIIVFIGAIIIMVLLLGQMIPSESIEGIENYNKKKIIEKYGSDIDSALFLFPDDTESMIEPTFISDLESDLFDTQGVLLLRTKYSPKDYEREVKRLSDTKCVVMDTELAVRLDTESYVLPAYVAIDGFDYVYEYALLDDENCEIAYLLLTFAESIDLSKYQEYLKKDLSEYEIQDSLNRFSIYTRKMNDGSYMEYSDETIIH